MDKHEKATINDYLAEWGRLVRLDRSMRGIKSQWDNGATVYRHDDAVMLKVFNCIGIIREGSADVYLVIKAVYVDRKPVKDAAPLLDISIRAAHQKIQRAQEMLYMFMWGAATNLDDGRPKNSNKYAAAR